MCLAPLFYILMPAFSYMLMFAIDTCLVFIPRQRMVLAFDMLGALPWLPAFFYICMMFAIRGFLHCLGGDAIALLFAVV